MKTAKPSLFELYPQIAPDIRKERMAQEDKKAKEPKNSEEDQNKMKKKTTSAHPQGPGKDILPPHRDNKGGGGGGGGRDGVAGKMPNGYQDKRLFSKSLQAGEDRLAAGRARLGADRALTAPELQPMSKSPVIRKSRSTTGLQSVPEQLRESHWDLYVDPDPVEVGKLHAAMRSEYKSGKQFETFFRQNGQTSADDLVIPPLRTGGSRECLLGGVGPAMGIRVREKWGVERTGSGVGQIRSIRGMCFTESGQLAIAERQNARVQVFSSVDGKPHRVLTDRSYERRMQPSGLSSVPGRSVLVAADLNRFVFLDPGFRDRWSSAVAVPDKTRLTGIACSLRGELVLTDTGVRPSAGLYSTDGKVIAEFKTVDWRKPKAVTISHELGITFVSDSEAGCVYMFDQDGRLLNRLGRTGDEGTRLVYPHGLCCVSRGTVLLVADRANLNVLVYDLRNRAVDRLVGVRDGSYSPVCLASWEDRYLAVSNEIHDLKMDDYRLRLFRTKM